MPPRTHSPLNFLSLGQILAACTCSTLIAVCAGGQVDPAAALAEQRLQTDRATGEPVRLATRSARLRIDDPASARSAAWIVDRAGDGVAAKAGGQDRRITLHAAVVAQAPAPLLRAAGFDAEPIAGVSGFARVDAASVSDAVVLAETVRALPGVVDASIASSRSFASRELPNDLALPFAWHLRNLEQPGNDVSAQEAWGLGYTGAGVRIGIMDEGVLTSHNDLAANHDASLSQVGITSNHGTSVAGIAAAVANNFAGAAGLAHGATFGQQYYFLGFDPDNIAPITNAEGFTFANDRIDIRNNSWGPIDTGAYDRLDPLEAAALETVTEQGRGGLGGIVVWAAGNGGGIDRVDYDGFASSRHTISIGAIGFLGTRATYNERGSSMLAVAWSDGNRDPDTFEARSIFAPSASSQFGFTQSFGGTSAAAPLASGALALALEANPSLSWRDAQHLIVRTALPVDETNALWSTNAAGHQFNDNYGFGRIDAFEVVSAAERWQLVGPAVSAGTGPIAIDRAIPDGDPNAGLSIDLPIDAQLRVEHAEIQITIEGTYIGDIAIELVSPAGTVSTLAAARNISADDLDHLFTSVKHWDEASLGTWTLRVSDAVTGDPHRLIEAELVIHGVCIADQDRSGDIAPADLAAWLDAYQQTSPDDRRDADANGDGQVTPADFHAFLRAYGAGC